MSAPLVKGEPGLSGLTGQVSDRVLLQPAGWRWWISLALALALTGLFVASVSWLFAKGVGIWGLDIPVAWGFAIANYVWWIGIGMAGTFISGGLYLTRQKWRNALNRYAEAMTVCAVSVSGFFPILHLGRPWFFYWLMPYPSRMGVWPQWRSSLFWDFSAIVAYLTASIIYFYVGLLPDLATLRDRARTRARQVFYGLLALGWRGEARHWKRYETLNLLMAGMAVPMVFSVHSMVGLDFSEGLLPGWHSTIFPPFFVAGALFSGFGMALLIAIPMRRYMGLDNFITERHLDNLAKATLAVGMVLDYSYFAEIFTAFYSGDKGEIALTLHRFTGAYAWVYWTTIACNVLAIQPLWFARVRRSQPALLVIGALVVIGMWFERFMLIVTTLYRTYLPARDGMFYPTFWDLALLLGSVGVFLLLFLLFVRWLPVLPIFELRKLVAPPGDKSA